MASLRLPSTKAIALQSGETLEVGRALLWAEWGLNVSRVQFDVELEKEESSMLGLVRVVGRGTVNKTVVIVGPQKKRIVLGLKDSAVLRHGDRIGLEGQRPALALRVEVESCASPERQSGVTEERGSAIGAEGVVAESVGVSGSGKADSVIGGAASHVAGSTEAPRSHKVDGGLGSKGIMLILIGIPGSGKSTFCKKLEKLGKWIRINQDSIAGGRRGSKDQCLKAARAALCSGHSCLIDRMNTTPDQREDFLDIARCHAATCHALVLNIEPQVCVERVVNRKDHEGGVQGKGGARVVHMNKNSLIKHRPPTLNEGFASVHICNNVNSVAEACEFWTKVTESEDIASSKHLKQVQGKVVGKLQQWSKPKSPPKNAKKSSPVKGIKRSQPESPSNMVQHGRKQARSSTSPKHTEGLRNAFDVLMASARKVSTTANTAEHPGSSLQSRPRSPPASATKTSKKSVKFPHAWQQVLHNIANRPGEHKAKFPGMLVDDSCVVIRDCFPKAKHHYLVIARDNGLEGIEDIRREHCNLLHHMKTVGESVTSKLTVPKGIHFNCGFHSVPSMRQLHMHVISTDFDGRGLKNKKHWNSFTTEFFLHLDDVVNTVNKEGCVRVDAEEAEEILKRPLACHRCKKVMQSMPMLNDHIRSCGI